jgi:transcriptional regulator with GAF, ATPase, and Fis domain
VRTSSSRGKIEEHKGTVESLKISNAENKDLKDRFQAENIYLHTDIDREFNFGEIIGRSNALESVFFKVEQVAPQEATFLLPQHSSQPDEERRHPSFIK